MLQPLTDRQNAIFSFIRDQIVEEGCRPTIREIMCQFGIASTSGMLRQIEALERKGWIARRAHASRGIALTDEARQQACGMPWSGTIAAGQLDEAIEQDERIDFADLLHRDDRMVLSVRGESMVDAHILDGDLVVVRQQKTAARGQIAVVRTADGQATVKYWFPERNRIRLQPANRRMQPIYVKEAEVVGVVVSVVRDLQNRGRQQT